MVAEFRRCRRRSSRRVIPTVTRFEPEGYHGQHSENQHGDRSPYQHIHSAHEKRCPAAKRGSHGIMTRPEGTRREPTYVSGRRPSESDYADIKNR
jgi:hypothetical protein